MSRRWVSSSCLRTSEGERPRFCSVICALKASMPPYCREYRGGLPPLRMSGRCFSASSSHHVTCARMSFTDQWPVTPGSIICASDKSAYDSLNVVHAWSSCFRSCCLVMVQGLPTSRHRHGHAEAARRKHVTKRRLGCDAVQHGEDGRCVRHRTAAQLDHAGAQCL